MGEQKRGGQNAEEFPFITRLTHVDHQSRTHTLECPVRELCAHILNEMLDQFPVSVAGFMHMLHIIHKILEDMAAAIAEGVLGGEGEEELQYFIMLTMYEIRPTGKIDTCKPSLPFHSSSVPPPSPSVSA